MGGLGSNEEKAVPQLLQMAQRYGIKSTFHIEPYSGRTTSSLQENVKYLYARYGSDPAFFLSTASSRYSPGNKPKPMFFVWDSDNQAATGTSVQADYWQPAMDAIHALPQGGLILADTDQASWIAGGHSSPTSVLKTGTTPCMPAIHATVGGQGLATLTWTDASLTTTGYSLDRTTTPSVKSSWVQIGTTASNVTKFQDLTAPCGQSLYYRVHAVNAQGSTISPTSAAAQTVCKPTTVMDLKFASSTSHSITLNWTATSGGQTSFILLRSVTGTDGWFEIATLQTTSSSYTDDGLAPGSTYYYRLEAVNAGGSALSNLVHGTTKEVIFLPFIRR